MKAHKALHAATLWLAASGAVLAGTAPPIEAPAAPAATLEAFPYVLGKTTMDEAKSIWSGRGMEILMSGHLALGTGSGIDGYSKVQAERVVLTDVSNVDVEGLPVVARFAFFDGTFYRFQAQLQRGLLSGNKEGDQLTDEQVKTVRARLLKKHGQPDAEEGKGKGKIQMWKRKGNTIVITQSNLIMSHDKSEAAITKYRKEYCKTINTKESQTCW
jgi:hypothetical protein